jgi:hypothetical protein
MEHRTDVPTKQRLLESVKSELNRLPEVQRARALAAEESRQEASEAAARRQGERILAEAFAKNPDLKQQIAKAFPDPSSVSQRAVDARVRRLRRWLASNG